MATASLPRSGRPQGGAGWRGSQRPRGWPGVALLALGLPAGRLPLPRCLGPASLHITQARPRAGVSSFALVGVDLSLSRDRRPDRGGMRRSREGRLEKRLEKQVASRWVPAGPNGCPGAGFIFLAG